MGLVSVDMCVHVQCMTTCILYSILLLGFEVGGFPMV